MHQSRREIADIVFWRKDVLDKANETVNQRSIIKALSEVNSRTTLAAAGSLSFGVQFSVENLKFMHASQGQR
jgi:endo-beta-N-acetylglucosaminidase D